MVIRFSFIILMVATFGISHTEKRGKLIKSDILHIQLEKNDSLILWSFSRKLTWDDFIATPDSNSRYEAITYTYIKSKVINYTNNELEYDISCSFEKNKSWTKLKTASLLKHEQLHFDIAELATRKMRKHFLDHTSLNRDSIKLMINSITQEAILGRKALNQKYDKETNHGIITSKQNHWEEKITKELKEMEKYSSTRVVIMRPKKIQK
jgi:hypothetical protein